MTEAILDRFNPYIDGLTLIPSDGSRFEITINGEQVFSKIASGRFPGSGELERMIKSKV